MVKVRREISDVAQIGPAIPARERILTTAYRLFTRRRIRAVSTDEVITQSGVAKATLYRHFPSKNDLVLAVLHRREELWTLGLVEQQSRLRGDTPEAQLLAFSRLSRLSSADSSVDTPGREPSSISAWRTHLRTVSVVPNPSNSATARMAVHSVSC